MTGKVSHMRRDSDLFKLTRLMHFESKNKFLIGDEVTDLVDNKGWVVTKLAKEFKWKRNRLSEIYHTSKTYGPDLRDYSIPFSRYELARIGVAKFDHSPKKALKLIMINKINQRRDAKRFFEAMKRDQLNNKSKLQNLHNNRVINRCHNEDCRSVARRLAGKSTKITFIDAPYGQYGKYSDGSHNKDGASLKNCDGNKTADVIELIEDMLRIMPAKIATGGVLLLCRPAGIVDPLHNVITKSAEKNGWEIANVLIWDKGRVQLGDGRSPYSFDSESIWVLNRRGDKIDNHDGSSRKTVLRFDPVVQRSKTAFQSHLYSKPIDLCKFLINKHSYEREICFDACGGLASFCISAIECNRQFVYCETNSQNYEQGSSRVYEATKNVRVKAG